MTKEELKFHLQRLRIRQEEILQEHAYFNCQNENFKVIINGLLNKPK